jgi:hypothetical protein
MMISPSWLDRVNDRGGMWLSGGAYSPSFEAPMQEHALGPWRRVAPAVTGPLTQLRALVRLRWTMLRAPGLRLALCLGALLVVYVALRLPATGDALEPAALASAVELAPAAFLGFALLAFIAPLVAGGGSELVPTGQLVVFPVRAQTQFLGGLALAPLNLVWVVQLLTITAETAYVSRDGDGARAALTTGSYVLCLTVLGQALAWCVTGLRQTRSGRRLVSGIAALAFLAVVAIVRTGDGTRVLRASPTRSVVHAVAARDDELLRWAVTTGLLLLLTAAGFWAGARLCSWSLRLPGDSGTGRELAPLRRRRARATSPRELRAVNRASVWRAPAIRRGALVLFVLPGVGAAGAALPWPSLVVLPGLVAAGAGLLFGVNAFSLDGAGAVWLASLPHDPRLVAAAKLWVVTETVLGTVVIAAVAGAVRSPGAPTPTEVVAIVCSALACTAVVVAISMSRSVRRPHHAELRGPRDAIAPPGALVLASVQLSLPVALVCLVFAGASQAGHAWVPLLLAMPVLTLAGLSVQRSLAFYDLDAPRASLVQTVSAG